MIVSPIYDASVSSNGRTAVFEAVNGSSTLPAEIQRAVPASIDLRQHRITAERRKHLRKKMQLSRLIAQFCSQGALNQASTENLSARYRFANANMIFSFAVCFRSPRYRVLRYPNSRFTMANTCSTLLRTDDFAYSLFRA